jgi:DNA repair exonuclease SbcCD ATPase subunit
MSDTFRVKRSREVKQEGLGGTLDSVHQTVLSSLKDSETDKESLEQQLRALQLSDSTDTLDCVKNYTDIQKLKQKLLERDSVSTYFLKNTDIFLKYYDQTETHSTTTSVNDSNTFMKYVVQQSSGGPTRKQIFDEYLSRMKLFTGSEKVCMESEHCMTCNVAREENLSEGILVCPGCGSEEYMMVVSDFAGFKDPPKERNNYAYKKINHLNEILNQFQAKESTIIPEDLMNEVVLEIRKRRIKNVADLCEKDIREILKKLNRSKYYEHAAHILSRLNGNPPPTITPEIEEKIRTMFNEIQAPFLLYCPNDRTNFLSYSYILYKFFELLELDEYKVYFPLLKSRDRLISHDQIWEKICEYLHWEFIRSV